MIRFKAMINIKITKRNITEDYIAVERETGSILLPSKHVFGIFSIGVISILLALPFGQLVPIEASPFSAFTAGRVEQNKKFEQAYLTNNEQVSEQNIEIASTAGSEENYDDEIVPEALLASNDIDESLASEDKANSSTQVNLSAHIPSVKEKFKATAIEPTQKDITDTTTSVNEKQEISLAVAQMQARIMEQKNDAKWYEQTVRKGDSLYKIFNYLNLDNNELKKIMAVAEKDSLNLEVGTKIQFLIDSNNDIQEIAIPQANGMQVRFLRDDQNNTYLESRETLFAQFEDLKPTNVEKSTTLPSFIEAQKEREQKQQELIAKNNAEREKQLLAKKLEEEKQAAKAELEKKLQLDKTRPRLIIGTINRRESFDSAAKRLGLSRAEIATIKNQYQGKINFRQLKANDTFRVLFNGIGTQASISAIVIDSQKYGNISLFKHPKTHIFYEEHDYQPQTGAFRRFPISGQIVVNSQFNLRRYHPIKKRIRPHYGVDFKLRIGTPIYAPADGVVTYASYMRGGGYTVIISHKGGYKTVYMHLSKFDVQKGQQVYIGQMIAKSGNTGNSTGPHLHYEVHVNGRAVDPLKVDLPSGSPEVAKSLKKHFDDTVMVLKSELYKNALAIRQE